MGAHRLLGMALLVLTAACGGGGDDPGRAQERPAGATAPATPSAPVTPVALTVHPVIGDGDAAAVASAFDPTQESTVLDEQGLPIRIGPATLTTEDVTSAEADMRSSQALITIDFTAAGAREWERLTGRAACQPPGDAARRIAILVDGQVVSSPQVAEPVACDVGIEGGSTQITGDFTEQEAQELARRIAGG